MKGYRTHERHFLQKFTSVLQHGVSYGFCMEAFGKRISPPTVKYWLYLRTAMQEQTSSNLVYHITLCNTASKFISLRLQRTDLQWYEVPAFMVRKVKTEKNYTALSSDIFLFFSPLFPLIFFFFCLPFINKIHVMMITCFKLMFIYLYMYIYIICRGQLRESHK